MSRHLNHRPRSTPLSAVLAATLVLFGAVACNSNKEAELTPPPVMQAVPVAQDDLARMDDDLAYDPLVVTLIGIDIDTRLAAMCGLDESKVFFKFDSAKLLPTAKERLDQIGTCATTGPLEGQALLVVGRTDPVGTDAYNELLGMSRADAVAAYLDDLGVDETLIVTESRGEARAEEAFPGSWPYDRRVTVRLAPTPDPDSPEQTPE